jgi:hypothetical protein
VGGGGFLGNLLGHGEGDLAEELPRALAGDLPSHAAPASARAAAVRQRANGLVPVAATRPFAGARARAFAGEGLTRAVLYIYICIYMYAYIYIYVCIYICFRGTDSRTDSRCASFHASGDGPARVACDARARCARASAAGRTRGYLLCGRVEAGAGAGPRGWGWGCVWGGDLVAVDDDGHGARVDEVHGVAHVPRAAHVLPLRHPHRLRAAAADVTGITSARARTGARRRRLAGRRRGGGRGVAFYRNFTFHDSRFTLQAIYRPSCRHFTGPARLFGARARPARGSLGLVADPAALGYMEPGRRVRPCGGSGAERGESDAEQVRRARGAGRKAQINGGVRGAVHK